MGRKPYVTGSISSSDFPVANPFPPANGGGHDAVTAKISNPPTMTAIRPESGAEGTSVNVTVTGTNFVSGSTAVAVNGTGVTVGPVNVASNTSLTTVFAIASSATSGTRYVTVTTPGGTSNGLPFIVRVPLFPRDN